MNLFFPVYQRIENEVCKLTDDILFTNEQLDVYSLAIGDLIIRCSIEIEAISKELYLRLGGNMSLVNNNGEQRQPYFDTDCIDLLVNKWLIDKKKVKIIHPNMYFDGDKTLLAPLKKAHKRGSSGAKWKRAYQSFKHSRANEIKVANIENMLNALGALYILNLYYSDESFWDNKPIKGKSAYSAKSLVFEPFIADATNIHFNKTMCDNQNINVDTSALEESIYIKKITDDVYVELHELLCLSILKSNVDTVKDEEFMREVHAGGNTDDVIMQAYKKHENDYIPYLINELRKSNLLDRLQNNEIVLNKNSRIYPARDIEEVVNSSKGKGIIENVT